VILPLPIMEANLDGTRVITVVPTAGTLPAAAALMPASRRMASKCRIRFPDVSGHAMAIWPPGGVWLGIGSAGVYRSISEIAARVRRMSW
jgi:hypothetical protein